MNDKFYECLSDVRTNLTDIKKNHSLGDTITEEEVKKIQQSAERLRDAAKTITKHENKNIKLECQKRATEIEDASILMKKYPTERSDTTELPTAYDNIILTIKWVKEKMDDVN